MLTAQKYSNGWPCHIGSLRTNDGPAAANFGFISHLVIAQPSEPLLFGVSKRNAHGGNSPNHISCAPLAESIGSQAFYVLCERVWKTGSDFC